MKYGGQGLEPGTEDNVPRRRATDGLDWQLPVSAPPEIATVGESLSPQPSAPSPLPAPGVPVVPTAPPQPPRGSRDRWNTAWLPGIALAGGLIGGAIAGLVVAAVLGSDDSAAPSQAVATSVPGSLTSVEITSAVADAAARARPSVVRVESTKHTPGGGTEHDVGSGVVLDVQGHIATNAHVVVGTDALKVIFSDGSERQALLLGHDYPFTDLAVLQVGPGNLRPIEAADSDALVQGELVLAIGEALSEFQGSTTLGVISGLNRKRYYNGVIQPDFIQTDAAVNQGNSGGALVNVKGQLVGMPTGIIRSTESGASVEGIAFALPSNRLLDIANQIIAAGSSIVRSTPGFEHIDLTPDSLARLPRLVTDEGAVVSSVPSTGPAAEAGIKVGDIVTMLGDQVINRQNPLLNALMRYEPGQVVKVVLNRSGRIIETEVRLAKRQ